MPDTNHMLAEEALFLGAAFAHIARYNEVKRIERRQREFREFAACAQRHDPRFAASVL